MNTKFLKKDLVKDIQELFSAVFATVFGSQKLLKIKG